jgi:hypothetical protein
VTADELRKTIDNASAALKAGAVENGVIIGLLFQMLRHEADKAAERRREGGKVF